MDKAIQFFKDRYDIDIKPILDAGNFYIEFCTCGNDNCCGYLLRYKFNKGK